MYCTTSRERLLESSRAHHSRTRVRTDNPDGVPNNKPRQLRIISSITRTRTLYPKNEELEKKRKKCRPGLSDWSTIVHGWARGGHARKFSPVQKNTGHEKKCLLLKLGSHPNPELKSAHVTGRKCMVCTQAHTWDGQSPEDPNAGISMLQPNAFFSPGFRSTGWSKRPLLLAGLMHGGTGHNPLLFPKPSRLSATIHWGCADGVRVLQESKHEKKKLTRQ